MCASSKAPNFPARTPPLDVVTVGHASERTPMFMQGTQMHGPYADLLKGRPVTAFMPLRFAAAHRFLAAREILVLPSTVKRPCLLALTFSARFFAALGET